MTLIRNIKLFSIFVTTALALILIAITSCDDREIELAGFSPFTFSADIGLDTLVLNDLYEVSLNIQMKDNTQPPLDFNLSYKVENGTGILYQNGTPFQSGSTIDITDAWTYQGTTIGVQQIVLTLGDQNGFHETATIAVEVLEFIPVPFNLNSNFTKDETFIQIEADLMIVLNSDDPDMKYVLNYEIMQGEGELLDNAGNKVSVDKPIPQGTSSWKYLPTGADNNELKFTVKDENGEEMISNASIFVDDRIPFVLTSSVQPATIRRNKSAAITLNISSTHPLFNTLNLTMKYSGNFDSDASLLDSGGATITPNSSIPINKGNTQFTYQPGKAGTHNITFTVSDEQGNGENTVAIVNAKELKKPEAQADSRFRLGSEICISTGDCQADLFLDVNLSGSVDGDANLGGFIVSYRLVIDRIEYTGDFNSNNPVVAISNGVAKYLKGEDKIYSNVVHRPNTAIQVELRDDDGLWSDPIEISAPGSLPD